MLFNWTELTQCQNRHLHILYSHNLRTGKNCVSLFKGELCRHVHLDASRIECNNHRRYRQNTHSHKIHQCPYLLYSHNLRTGKNCVNGKSIMIAQLNPSTTVPFCMLQPLPNNYLRRMTHQCFQVENFQAIFYCEDNTEKLGNVLDCVDQENY